MFDQRGQHVGSQVNAHSVDMRGATLRSRTDVLSPADASSLEQVIAALRRSAELGLLDPSVAATAEAELVNAVEVSGDAPDARPRLAERLSRVRKLLEDATPIASAVAKLVDVVSNLHGN